MLTSSAVGAVSCVGSKVSSCDSSSRRTLHRLHVRIGNAGSPQPASQAETAKQINKTNLRENMSPDCGRTTDIWKTTNALRTV